MPLVPVCDEDKDLDGLMLNQIGTQRLYNNNFVEYKKDVILWDVIAIKPEQELLFKIIGTNSKYRQGVRLAIDVGDGFLEINGIQSKGIQLWEDTCPEEAHIKCNSSAGFLSVYNIFDIGSEGSGVRSQVPSCGMILEETGNLYRYYCNDAGFETNFDKLIFEIYIM